jgi:hypothetical protein
MDDTKHRKLVGVTVLPEYLQFESINGEIDRLVYEPYGLSDEKIRILK